MSVVEYDHQIPRVHGEHELPVFGPVQDPFKKRKKTVADTSKKSFRSCAPYLEEEYLVLELNLLRKTPGEDLVKILKPCFEKDSLKALWLQLRNLASSGSTKRKGG